MAFEFNFLEEFVHMENKKYDNIETFHEYLMSKIHGGGVIGRSLAQK